jgi:predicted site-specific integrase-resolvase
MKTYSTREVAKMIGRSHLTLLRWLSKGIIRPSVVVPYDGRHLWRWTAADVERARRLKATQKPGPKPKRRRA